jgi:lysyl-tRNA synthetase class 2
MVGTGCIDSVAQQTTIARSPRTDVANSEETLTTVLEKFEADRLAKLKHIEALGLDPWGGRFDSHQPIAKVRSLPVAEGDPLTAGPPVRIAGRIRTIRRMGRIIFLDLADATGKIQVLIGQKQVGELNWQLCEYLDLGDLLGVDGRFGKTKTGELTVFAQQLHYLAKSLLPHPDKWSGIEDVEFALRHRYLDLIYNPELRNKALTRVRIIQHIRDYLNRLGYLEVETPVLQTIAGGAAARPFVTHHNALDIDLYLRIALELHLKRLLVAGFEKIYEIGRVFRNEGISPKHNPEFTMLELYQAYGDYNTMMDLTEGLISSCVELLGHGRKLHLGDQEMDFTPPWPRVSYTELFRQHIGVDWQDTQAVLQAAQRYGIDTAGKERDVLVHYLFEEVIEDKLVGPVFVYDYPASLCPLTKRKRDNPEIAERFELYIQGMELANAYTELNDPITQEATFRRQLAGLPEEESMARMDEDFIKALKYGMPPAGGLGIGIDRLVMVLTGSRTIRDVILFPLLRPEKRSPEPPSQG